MPQDPARSASFRPGNLGLMTTGLSCDRVALSPRLGLQPAAVPRSQWMDIAGVELPGLPRVRGALGSSVESGVLHCNAQERHSRLGSARRQAR